MSQDWESLTFRADCVLFFLLVGLCSTGLLFLKSKDDDTDSLCGLPSLSTMTDRIFPKRTVDLVSILDWIGRLLTVYWMLRRLQRLAGSRTLLLPSMKAVRWLAIIRYSLPEGKLPSSGHPVTIPLDAIHSPFLNLMNFIHLRLAFKYNPKAWFAWKSLILWTLRYQLRDSSVIDLWFTLQPIAYPEQLT